MYFIYFLNQSFIILTENTSQIYIKLIIEIFLNKTMRALHILLR